MALTALKGKKLRKKKEISRRKGASLIPFQDGWEATHYYFQTEVTKKDIMNYIKTYVKNNFTKAEARKILAVPEYKFNVPHYGCTAFWLNSKLDLNENIQPYVKGIKKHYTNLITLGEKILNEKKIEKKVAVSISPMERLQKKISDTIMQDLLDLEDQWIEGEKVTIDLYKLFQSHSLSGSATMPVRQVVEGWLLDYEDAYHKRDEQAVEGYSHLKKPELNRRIKACQEMLLDLDKIQSAAKANRKVRVPKAKSADKQVAKVQYKKEDNDFKLVSINPILLVGSRRLFAFHCKERYLIEYCTQSVNGFEISGTTIKNIDSVNSRQVRLRKPDEFIPIVLKKTIKQIDSEWKKLTTKTTVPTGRINKDIILLRVMDK
tara:strand:+ start:1375 stop:2502 length:1128 start_codon:yes stop_codon:yes gene_type:complete